MSNRNYNKIFNNHVNEKVETPVEETENNEELTIETPVEETENNEELTIETPVEETENNEELTIETPVEETENNEESNEELKDNIPTQIKNTQFARVEVPSLNIRKKPTKESEIVAVVKKYQTLELRESTSIDGFYAVKTENGIDGYCMEEFVSLV